MRHNRPVTTPYEITEEARAPGVPGRALVRPSVDEALAAACADLYLQAGACVRSFGQFHLAMGYGPDEHRLVVRLMTDPNYRELPWSRTHLWSLREQRVPMGDDRHSQTHLQELILHGSDLPAEQAHPMPAHLHDAEARYESELCEHLSRREPGHDRLDCVVVPSDPAVLRGLDDPLGRLVGPTEDGLRVGMTARLLRASRLVMVLATGDQAGGVLRKVADTPSGVGIVPTSGELRWYLDRRACGSENLENPA